MARGADFGYLRPNLDRRPIRHRVPNLLNLFIRHRDASIRPILQPMRRTHPPISIGQSVHKNIPAGRNSSRSSRGAIPRVRIRNVNRLVKLAMRVPRIENVRSLGSLVIPSLRFRPHWISTQSHFIRLDNFPLAQKLQRALFLKHDHSIGVQALLRRLRDYNSTQEASSKHPDSHARIIVSRPAAKCYADKVQVNELLGKSRTLWRQPPRLSREGEAERLPSRTYLLWLVVIFFIFILSLPSHALPWTVHSQPARLLNGAPVLFQVKPPSKLDSLTGTWLGHQLTFSYNSSTKTWFALAGVSIETNPGKYTLDLSGERAPSKSSLKFSRTFLVARANYPKIKVQLAVEKKFTEPTPEQLKEIDEGKKVKDDYLNRVTPDREWHGNFAAPVDAATSDVFGSQRIFNGVAQRPHFGLDYRVPTGTPVAAMNGGTILLARFLYFEGNCVVIDHGQGLLTLYFHLSEIKVKERDPVKRGEEIGLSGGTGRATGPHLHVAVRWLGTYLDPARLIQLSLP